MCTKLANPGTNGFVERLNGTVMYEFFLEAFHKTFFHPLMNFMTIRKCGFTTKITNARTEDIETTERDPLIR